MGRKNTAKQFARAAEQADKRDQVMALRVSGLSMGAIAERLRMSKSTVKKQIDASLQALAEQDADNAGRYRALTSMRYDRLLAAVWDMATRGSLNHVREARAILEAHAKLLGLNAPVKVAATDPEGKPMATQFWVPVPADISMAQWLAQHTQSVAAPSEETEG